VFDPAFDPPVVNFGSEGVADLAARLTVRESRSAKVDEFAERVAARFPWLDEDTGVEGPYLTYEQGRTVIHGARGHWIRQDGDARSWRDPMLVLDLLAGYPLDDGRREADERVRDSLCVRYGGRLDARRFEEARGAAPSETPDRTVQVKAWVDGHDRIARASWLFARTGRPRSPFRPTHAPAWRTVELWDFGLDVDIQMPDVPPQPPRDDEDAPSAVAVAGEIARDLWRVRRDWTRKRRGRI
jgi:hypothetical protein